MRLQRTHKALVFMMHTECIQPPQHFTSTWLFILRVLPTVLLSGSMS